MATIHFFRIEIFQDQSDMITNWPGASEILSQAIDTFPDSTADWRTKHFASQFQFLDDSACYFQITRRSKTKAEDFKNDEFIEVEYPDYPHAKVIIDWQKSLLVVERKNSYSRDITVVAARIARWIRNFQRVTPLKYTVHITPIKNPRSLISEIENARAVRRFYFDVKRENVIDTAQLAKNVKKFTAELNGESTRTETTGSNMDRDSMVEIINSSASTGDDAGAQIIRPGRKTYSRVSLGKNFLTEEVKDAVLEKAEDFLQVARDIYERVRRGY